MIEQFMSEVPMHRELNRYETFKNHLGNFHGCNLFFELQDGEVVFVGGIDLKQNKKLKFSCLASIAENLVVKLGETTKDLMLAVDPEVNFIFLEE